MGWEECRGRTVRNARAVTVLTLFVLGDASKFVSGVGVACGGEEGFAADIDVILLVRRSGTAVCVDVVDNDEDDEESDRGGGEDRGVGSGGGAIDCICRARKLDVRRYIYI